MVRSPCPLNAADNLREEAIAIALVLRLRAVMTPHMDTGIRCLSLASTSPCLDHLKFVFYFFIFFNCPGLQPLHQ